MGLVAVVGLAAAPAQAQVGVSGGVDFPTTYYFRGAKQEIDPKLTLQPWVDVGGTLMEGDGALKSASLNVGTWNSLHTGSNKDDFDGAFYESDLYASLGLAFSGWSLATTYTAYTYPAPEFDAIHEIAVKASVDHMLAPYGMVAFEFAEDDPGTYVELGVGPSFPLTADADGPSLTIPVKLAFDAKDYYGGDTGFAFFSVGGTVTYPLGQTSAGSWGLRAGAEVLMLSDTLEFFNFDGTETSKSGFWGFVGITFSN
jgi:hypothetical protein